MSYWTNLRSLKRILLFTLCIFSTALVAQETDNDVDLLALLGEEEEVVDYTYATFKANRIINLHSVENTAKGVLDIKISHRFGYLNSGISDLFGIDQASIRIGGDYGITDQFMVGVGRSSFEKTYDGFLKYKILRQSQGAKVMPISISFLSSMAVKTIPFQNPDRENYFSSRLYYAHQILIGRKFSESFSFQLSPTLVHRNLVRTSAEANDVYSIGAGGRMKLTKRTSLNLEYIYVLPNQLAPGYRNSFSIGFDIETGGHVFQLHFTNSTSMIEKGFITESVGNWANGDVHFGFNVSRVFTLRD
jgi:hypothetical protein